MTVRHYGRKTTFYPTVATTHKASRFSQRLASGVTISDFFCGAGGSSTGLKKAGSDVVVASNHWQLAVDTHETNHPDTHHYCEDLSAADPRNYPSTTGAWFSPECTWHSPAGGRARPTKQQYLFTEWEPEREEQGERSRATMWDVVRFAECHRYKFLIVENVSEVLEWELFDIWWRALTEGLGYQGRRVSLNSMFCWPTPQSRDRIYMVFWQKTLPTPDLNITPLAYCAHCEADVASIQSWKNGRVVGKYKRQYVYCCPRCAHEVTPYYYCAANAIDWAQPIERIGDRKRALKPKTMERIQAGLEKYGRHPILLVANHREVGSNARVVTRDPWPTQLTNMTAGLTLPGQPFVLAPGTYGLPQGIYDEVLPSQTCNSTPHFIVPWLLEIGHGGEENAGRIKAITDPTATIHTFGGMGLAAMPMLVPLEYASNEGHNARAMSEPWPTQSTRQAMGMALAPLLMDSGGAWETDARPVTEPYPTQTIRRTPGMLMAPYVVVERAHQDARSITDPLATVATGNHNGVALAPHPFVTAYNGELNEPQSVFDEPLSTATSVQRHALGFPPPPDSSELPDVEDCYYRTLKAHEVKAAMGFPREYKLLGDSRSQVKMAGNAVTPPAASVLAERVMAIVK